MNFYIVLQDVESDASGRKVLMVPCGKNTMDQCQRALGFLQRRQQNRLVEPLEEPLLRLSLRLKNTIEEHCKQQVIGVLRHEMDLSSNCTIRNTYDKADHIR